MYDELFPDARSASLGQILQRPADPATPPGVWRGFGSAVADALPYAANTSASAWSAVMEAYGHAAAYRDAPTNAMVNGDAAPDPAALQAQTIDQMGNSETARGFREQARRYAPDPASVGIAGQVVHGLISGMAKMTTYAAAGPAGPALFGLDTGINRAQELTDQGVDEGNRAGLVAESVISDMNRWAESNIGKGWTAKLANATMKASLLEAWTDAIRRGFSVTQMGALGKLSRMEWQALEEADRWRLASRGITETDFRVWNLAQPEAWRGSQMLSLQAVRAIPEAELAAVGLSLRDQNRAVSRLLGFISDESEFASLSQDLNTRAALTRGTQKGTIEGELMRSIALFKGFPLAMISRHWGRTVEQWRHGEKVSSVAYAAGLMSSLTIFGALAVQLKDMVSGKDPRPMDTPKFWAAAFTQGGGFGVFGDILYTGMGGQNRAGVPNWMSLLGPVLGSGAEALDLTLGNAGEALKGKETHAGAEALRFAKSHLPFLNLWYAKAAIDHAGLQDLQEYLSPGYLSRMQDRAQKEWGQSFWWQPGQGMPERGPDLERAMGR